MSPTPAPGNRQADRRSTRRISAPMTVVIGNAPYAIGDWSLGGLRVLEYSGALEPGDCTAMRVFVPTAGPGALFRTSGEVRRKDDDDGSVGVAFNNLDSVAFATLNRYFRERVLRGTL
ncbi:PilZ domain-containing protein [Thalassobaculum salexigens]|uniref:PilZ domain-containing protein n=1 Tax=Thalassobaculum salexigens TaxID=455360 RepID=UPI0003FE0622|nr:PilZ domain-containing protein [Thalassobaculum salexigens]